MEREAQAEMEKAQMKKKETETKKKREMKMWPKTGEQAGMEIQTEKQTKRRTEKTRMKSDETERKKRKQNLRSNHTNSNNECLTQAAEVDVSDVMVVEDQNPDTCPNKDPPFCLMKK